MTYCKKIQNSTTPVITPEVMGMITHLQQEMEKVRTSMLAIEYDMNINDHQYDEISYICNMLNDMTGYMERVTDILPHSK